MSTLHALLAERARTTPDALAYTFLDGDVAVDRTWADLHGRAGRIAGSLREAGVQAGDRALLLFPEGLDYLEALYGCMRAGVLAVPAHPPDPRRLDRTLPRVHAIHRDAAPAAVLAPAAIHAALRDDPVLAGAVRLVPADGAGRFDDVEAELAYLQYTSGSTADPKGVMVSHANLLHQLADFDHGYAHTDDAVIVSWIPATHDLGLVYGRYMGLFKGIRTVFFDPAAFMARPRLWLEALTRFRGTHSPSPNFGFEYAARRVTDVSGLDLAHVRVLLNGAEPIRSRSEAAFVERFAPAGLRPEAVTHAMGMSEATAKIVTEPIERRARFLTVDPDALADNRAVESDTGIEVASNGRAHLDTVVRIVDPETCEDLGEHRVGELWVGGTTVAQGYWNRPEATEATFRAHTTDGAGPFLRTGDLGFLYDGELFLVGRRKDVLIIRGQNHHPQDLEWAVDGAHPALRSNCAAAFGVEVDGEEVVALVAEVRPEDVDTVDAVFAAIRGRLADAGLAPGHLALLPPGGLPKTSSGKIRRREAQRRFVHGDLGEIARWDRPVAPGDRRPPKPPSDLRELMVRATAALVGLDPRDIETDQPFKELGLDSVTAVELVDTLGKTLGRELAATLLWDHPTIDALARALEGEEPAEAGLPETPSSIEDDVAGMSEAEAEAALLAELDDL
ncbi:MAG: AMP-binding protein [Alphaproteobacteria bacterium]|nr:AMP-binding protein [Alphaproteobacteria bacterium]